MVASALVRASGFNENRHQFKNLDLPSIDAGTDLISINFKKLDVKLDLIYAPFSSRNFKFLPLPT